MPVTISMDEGSPHVKNTADGYTITCNYTVHGTGSALTARAELPHIDDYFLDPDIEEPDEYDYDPAQCTSVDVWPELSDTDGAFCRAVVEWTYSVATGDGGSSRNRDSWEIDSSPATQHVTHVTMDTKQQRWDYYHTTGWYSGETAIGPKGNVDEEPDGVDLYVPASICTVTKHFNPEDITDAYLRILDGQRCTVNIAAYTIGKRQYEAGELLFLV